MASTQVNGSQPDGVSTPETPDQPIHDPLPKSDKKKRIVIVGLGMVGVAFM